MDISTRHCGQCGREATTDDRFCRSCGAALDAPATVATVTTVAASDDRQLIDKEIAAYTQAGWKIVSRNESSFQAAKPKQASAGIAALLVMAPGLFGLLALCIYPSGAFVLFGIALIGAVLVGIDYLTKKDELRFITAQNIRSYEAAQAPASTAKQTR